MHSSTVASPGVGHGDSVRSTERLTKRKASGEISDVSKKKDKHVRFGEQGEQSTIVMSSGDGSISVTGSPRVTVAGAPRVEEMESGTRVTIEGGVSSGGNPDDDEAYDDGQHEEREGRDADELSSGSAPSRAPRSSGPVGGGSGMSGTPSNPAPSPAATAAVATGFPAGTVFMRWPAESSAAVSRHRKRLQVPEYDGQHGSVVTWLQQVDNAVEMAATVNGEEWAMWSCTML